MTRRSITVLALAAVAGLGLAPPGEAAKKKKKKPKDAAVSISLEMTADFALAGTVTSTKASCVTGRTVSLWLDRGGEKRLVGRTTVGEDGSYAFPPRASGPQFAEIEKKKGCKAGKSATIEAEAP